MAKAAKATTPPAKMLTNGSVEGGAKSPRGADRAQKIIKVAEKLFHERGYSDTSMDDIARSVGILKGSLYYYVNSKEDLLFHIVANVHDTVTDLLNEACAREDLSPLDRFLEYVRLQLHHNAKNITELAVYYHDWNRLEGDRVKEIERRRHENETIVLNLLTEAQDSGQIPADINVRLALSHSFAVLIWPYTWYKPNSKFSAAQLADSGTAFVRKALSV